MLTVHRRHTAKCQQKKNLPTTELDRCDCPLICMGVDGLGVYHNREAIHTRDKFTAFRICREIEDGRIARPQITAEEWTVARALGRYREIMTTQRGWKPETVLAHAYLHGSLLRFCLEQRLKYLRELDANRLLDWMTGWEIQASTRAVRINMVKKLFDMAWRLGWIATNPALVLETPRVSRSGTTAPFDLERELPRVMAAIPHWEDGVRVPRKWRRSLWHQYPRTASALLLVLRWTGMRISDAFLFEPRALERRQVDGQEVYCYHAKRQKKTDHPVFLPLFPEEIEPILSAPRISERHMFWDGVTDLRDWNSLLALNCLKYLERVSGVAHIHPHRFRDTFAVDLLSRGADIRAVSRLLGHTNPATTLRYYEHYLPSDQNKLIRSAMNARNAAAERESNVIRFPLRNPA